MTRGLPGSGKSTWSEAQAGAVVVCKDDIRAEQFKKDWNYDVEKEVLRVRDFRVEEALSKGKWVISADTNLAPKHEARLRGLAKKYKATFEIKDFTKVAIEVCIERDANRDDKAKVGEKVIRDMHLKFLEAPRGYQDGPIDQVEANPYVPDETLPRAILVDLDGTIAIHGGRDPYDTARAGEDLLNEPIAELVHMADDDNCTIIYVSGREEKFREVSQTWLIENGCPWHDLLFMRPTGDTRNDAIVKRELFDAHIRDKYNVRFVLDDRDRVVKAWRQLGLTCLQVAPGNF